MRVTSERILEYALKVKRKERSGSTVSKYTRDINDFAKYAEGKTINGALVLEYKEKLGKKYAKTSANTIISALNGFLRCMGREDCCVKQFKVQKKSFCSEKEELTEAEYKRLVNAAENSGKKKLSLIIQTLCGMGIRISELEYITVESLKKGEAVVSCKNKTRKVFIVKGLRKKLNNYVKSNHIKEGAVFVTRYGNPVNRSNVWREMKKLCKKASVDEEKVFPHNLRHLFARSFYTVEKDLSKLADILGHSNINTTRIYIMTTYKEHCRIMEKMRLVT